MELHSHCKRIETQNSLLLDQNVIGVDNYFVFWDRYNDDRMHAVQGSIRGLLGNGYSGKSSTQNYLGLTRFFWYFWVVLGISWLNLNFHMVTQNRAGHTQNSL